MIDHFSTDMLTGNDSWHNISEHQNGFEIAHHQKFGDDLLHFNEHNQYDGHSQHIGNSVQHFDQHNMYDGHSTQLGSQTMHFDNHNMVSGFEQTIGDQTYQYDQHHQLVSRTDAFGHTYGPNGMLLSTTNKS